MVSSGQERMEIVELRWKKHSMSTDPPRWRPCQRGSETPGDQRPADRGVAGGWLLAQEVPERQAVQKSDLHAAGSKLGDASVMQKGF